MSAPDRAERAAREAHERWVETDSDEDYAAWQAASKALVEQHEREATDYLGRVAREHRALVERRVADARGVR